MTEVRPGPLVVIETHPVQYHAPVYRCLEDSFGVPVHVVYGSDFSIAGYRDREFGASFAWDSDLLGRDDSYTFLTRAEPGSSVSVEDIGAARINEVLRYLAPAAVMLTGYHQRFYRESFAAAHRLGRPLLYRAETTDHAVRRHPVKAWARDRILRRLYARYDALLPIGSRSLEHYRRLGVEERRLWLSPYCVDTTPFHCEEEHRLVLRASARTELGIPADATALLFSGKLSQRKGVHVLMDAARLLPDDLKAHLHLVFLGDGQERAALSRVADQFHLAATFAGFRNQSQLSPVYHASDALVLPSLHGETWGLVVNEALHHGLQAVVSDAVGCSPDLVEPGVTGEVACTGSASDLASALDRAIRRVGSAETRDRCRSKVAQNTVHHAAAGIYRALADVNALAPTAA